MSEVIRLSLSLEPSLYEELEALVARAGYANRSEFFRDLIRARLVEDEWAGDGASVMMTGPAAEVFTGRVPLEEG